MSEQLGRGGRPGRGLQRLYGRWAAGGAGMLLTGNIMVDPEHLESPRNIVLTAQTPLEPLQQWAASCEGVPLWGQLNHPGRQTPRSTNPHPLAPSAVEAVALMRQVGAFGRPRAMTEADIERTIGQFATAAAALKASGFDGVQLHGAHGYLISQFLSPRTNQRADDWGGTLPGRARFLLASVRAVRAAVGPAFPVSVKLNSADFQQGGFTPEDAMAVLAMLDDEGVDLVEISGGSYESAAMLNLARESTAAREAYFLEFAAAARAQLDTPIMVTGGFRSAAAMEEALADGSLDVVGMARPFANNPDIAAELLSGARERAAQPLRLPGLRRVSMASEAMLSVAQMGLMARGLPPSGPLGPVVTLGMGLVRSLVKR